MEISVATDQNSALEMVTFITIYFFFRVLIYLQVLPPIFYAKLAHVH